MLFIRKKFFLCVSFILFFSASVFSQNEITLDIAQKIGKTHNKYMALGIQNKPMKLEELKNNFMKMEVENLDEKTKNDIGAFVEQNNTSKQEEYVVSNLKTQNGKDIFYSVKNIVLTTKNFSDLSKKLDAKITETQKINGKDKEVLFVFIETVRNSANFWFPDNQGGENGGGVYETQGVGDINWGAIAFSDGAGAAGTLMRTYMLAASPVTWGMIISAIGWGAAWSSGASLLYQLMN